MKKSVTSPPKLNNRTVEGEGYLQPGVNHWIGVFKIDEGLFEDETNPLMSMYVEYEGPFNCQGQYVEGHGNARIIHIQRDEMHHKLVLNVEGIDKPVLESDDMRGA